MPQLAPERICIQAFIDTGSELIRTDTITHLDLREIEQLRLTIHHAGGIAIAERIQAIESVLLLKPSALEGKCLRWKKGVWAIHNLFGHPLLQLCAWLKMYRLGFWIHDQTVPKASDWRG